MVAGLVVVVFIVTEGVLAVVVVIGEILLAGKGEGDIGTLGILPVEEEGFELPVLLSLLVDIVVEGEVVLVDRMGGCCGFPVREGRPVLIAVEPNRFVVGGAVA